jgi:hypothetical protein
MFGRKNRENAIFKCHVTYGGGHKAHPGPIETNLLVYKDRIELEALELKIPFSIMMDVKFTTKPPLDVGVADTGGKPCSVIEYRERIEMQQIVMFVASLANSKKLEKANNMIHDRMLEIRQKD